MAAAPVGTGFGERVPERSLINSLRRREREGQELRVAEGCEDGAEDEEAEGGGGR